jgi:hypothetical protein
MTFPVGYHSLHPDASMNFQMNRWFGWVGWASPTCCRRCRQPLCDISALIRQDVLLLAGSEDHYVPMEQWYDQIGMLKNARSITARLFTRSECAQNHCQVGNYGLALRTIVNWLDGMLREDARTFTCRA